MNGVISGRDLFQILSHPRIVAIDNREDHLNLIQQGLFQAGIPCVAMLYDEAVGLKIPVNWNPASLRIIFLDLNLTSLENIGENMGRAIGPITEVLEKLQPQGPYLIAFWTSYAEQVGELMSTLAVRAANVQLPIDFVTIEKEPFITPRRKPNRLKNKIAEVLSKNKAFLAMIAWESEVEGAALRTFERLHKLVERRQPGGCSLSSKDLVDLLKNLAKQAWGKEQAQANPGAAITSGLSPLLLDSLDAITSKKSYVKIWKSALIGSWNRRLPGHVSPAQLNSHYMVDMNSSDRKCRGAWLEFTDAARENNKLWVSCFGRPYNDLVEEFINLRGLGNAAAIRARVRLGILECTAACDYANNKAPLRRYILCALIPEGLKGHIKWDNPDRKTNHNAIHELDKIFFEDEEFLPYIDFRFTLKIPPRHRLLNQRLLTMAFRVRSQVLADISARFAFHTTRPGVYSF